MHLVTFTALAEFPDRLEAHFKVLPTELYDWRPPSWASSPCGELTAIQQLRVIKAQEIERFQVCISRALLEEKPDIRVEAIDAVEAGDESAEDLLKIFREARKRTLSILEGLNDEQWKRAVILGDHGETTVLGLVHFLSSHDLTQLAGLQWLQGEANLA
ncbi:DinB family protein [Asticcacaulis sp.]|uniref:DinB family protein n=1 Tax=Asticcacaulis sp. TaxID=1872648 RepID=UPI003F7C2FD5